MMIIKRIKQKKIIERLKKRSEMKTVKIIVDGKSRQQRFEELIEYTERLDKEKQDLIKYLEDKIKECDYEIQKGINLYTYAEDYRNERYEERQKVYKEILDKLKDGNYEI